MPAVYTISLDGGYEVSDHGIEFFVGTSVALTASALYGNDLKGKLRRDVLTISQQTLTAAQKAQVKENLGFATQAALNETNSNLTPVDVSSSAITSMYTGFELCEVRKMGRVLQIYIVTPGLNWAENDIIATLSAGYRPLYKIYCVGYIYGEDNPIQILVDPVTGNISIYGTHTLTAKKINLTVMFFTA